MVERFWDSDPEAAAEAERLRRQYRDSQAAKVNGRADGANRADPFDGRVGPGDPDPTGPGFDPDDPLIAARMAMGPAGVTLADFHAYMPKHNYMYAPARELWPAASVNGRLGRVPLFDAAGNPVIDDDGVQVEIPASAWLDVHKPVEMMTWAPGESPIIKDKLVSEGGWVDRPKVKVFNLYRPPPPIGGDPKKAGRWLRHLLRIYPDKTEARHIACWLAHRIQRPAEKINHALVLGGLQGVGKDTLLEPVKRAVGHWNCQEASPTQVMGRFNGFLKSTILRMSEARDLGEMDRYKLYEHMKAYIAAPPDVLRVDEKNLREHYIINCCGVIITTNHKANGIYLPEDDRRHFVVWSPRKKEDFSDGYWKEFWGWYDSGGDLHVAAYLAQLDLTQFNPKAPPPKTAAFWDIVTAHRAPENAELADILDCLGNPAAVTLRRVIESTRGPYGTLSDFGEWLKDRRNRPKIPHRFEDCGYVPVRNPNTNDKLWRIQGRREVVYGQSSLTPQARLAAAELLR
jgi:hypothetical protein